VVDAGAGGAAGSRTHADDHRRVTVFLVILSEAKNPMSADRDWPPNKRGAGKGGSAVLWRAGRAWPALPDRQHWADCAA
jgi:hypothetical protein